MQDWGWLNEQMQAIVRGLRNLDMNVVMTCHLKQVVDEETGRVSYRPALSGAIGNDIASYVDLALVLETHTVAKVVGDKAEQVRVRTLVTVPDNARPWIKDRSGKLPETIEVNFQDDFARIHEMIYSNLNLPDTVEIDIDDSSVMPRTPETVAPVAAAQVVSDAAPASAAVPVQAAPKAAPKVAPKSAPKAAPLNTPTTPKATAVKPGPLNAPVAHVAGTPRNVLPPHNEDGEPIVPISHNYGTDIYCVECGGEVEDETTSDMSRIRFRKILDKKCFEELKR
jgi:hypothetical protein